MTFDKINYALDRAKDTGVQNALCLSGDATLSSSLSR